MSETLALTKALINQPSLTPMDAGCQDIISQRLRKLNFTIEPLRFGEVDNLWARFGTQGPLFVFAGHTDVVPTGPLTDWLSPPFTATERNGLLFGRGATDMKSGLAAMVIAAENFLKTHPTFPGSIGFLITSDEEGPSINGTKAVMETLLKRQIHIDYCVIGEASSDDQLGDQIRVGRRGSLHGKLLIHGKQGHIAFPENAKNPIHACFTALQELVATTWDNGNAHFPATHFQISNIHGGTGALNVIPGHLEVNFNFRYSTAVTVEELKQRVANILSVHAFNYDLEWKIGADPFLTKQGKLISATSAAIHQITQLETRLSTGGGTSDGRFIAPTGAEVVELGPINKTAHQVNEQVSIADLEQLTLIYEQILKNVFL